MTNADLSVALAQLMKGVVYRDTHETQWRHVIALQTQVRDYFTLVGLSVIVDEAEGYAFLRSSPDDDDDAPALPRLIPRRSLSLHVSLLLALLRKKLAEHDATGGEARLVLSREQIVETLRVFMASTSNEARLVDQIDSHLGKIVDLGYLRRIGDGSFEVRRILKAFVDAEWLSGFNDALDVYTEDLAGRAKPGEA
ncbi:DUF4194 domain-containing protein [Embleya hyalina]|uniref:DUF4194 domain-containing protein n=1 Tax=Embleya hyalina TaxID=516124 RepID=A0A401YYE0_9ACTN|nr:DUF4194 domain-containing protein [Embleya hyalina]GCD99639.1 hypothetical protein EHYA_07361 [Embleya hyalina]